MGVTNKEGPSLVNSVGDFAQLSYRAYDSVTDVTRHIIRHLILFWYFRHSSHVCYHGMFCEHTSLILTLSLLNRALAELLGPYGVRYLIDSLSIQEPFTKQGVFDLPSNPHSNPHFLSLVPFSPRRINPF